MMNTKHTFTYYLSPWRYVLAGLRRLFHYKPEYLINFIFQRIFGLNDEIPWSVHFTSRVGGDIEIAPDVRTSFAVSGGCYIQGINGIKIGEGTIFGYGVKIISANHSKTDLSKWDKCRPIEIGKHCWLGANVVICPGVHIGDNSVIGAGAVVTHDIPPNSVAVGVPAKVIETIA